MPRVIEGKEEERIDLGDMIEAVESGGYDPEDEDSLAELAPMLKRLSNNRAFLADLALAELKQRCSGQIGRNHYNAQVILLHGGSRKFNLRACFWPAETCSVVANSGKDPFFYEFPHDHNFSFLTVGYLGPGYWSDYYEYDYAATTGATGEAAGLRFVERSRLSEGRTLLYRKHVDVHSQLLPDALSVSLNVIAISARTDFLDQYRFDLERREVAGILNPCALEPLLALAARMGGGNGRDLVESVAASHPSDRVRFAAVRAQAAQAPDVDARIARYEEAASRQNGFVRAMALRHARRLQESREEIERSAA